MCCLKINVGFSLRKVLRFSQDSQEDITAELCGCCVNDDGRLMIEKTKERSDMVEKLAHYFWVLREMDVAMV